MRRFELTVRGLSQAKPTQYTARIKVVEIGPKQEETIAMSPTICALVGQPASFGMGDGVASLDFTLLIDPLAEKPDN